MRLEAAPHVQVCVYRSEFTNVGERLDIYCDSFAVYDFPAGQNPVFLLALLAIHAATWHAPSAPANAYQIKVADEEAFTIYSPLSPAEFVESFKSQITTY